MNTQFDKGMMRFGVGNEISKESGLWDLDAPLPDYVWITGPIKTQNKCDACGHPLPGTAIIYGQLITCADYERELTTTDFGSAEPIKVMTWAKKISKIAEAVQMDSILAWLNKMPKHRNHSDVLKTNTL